MFPFTCPPAGYPQPPPTCGCGCHNPANPGPYYPPPDTPEPPSLPPTTTAARTSLARSGTDALQAYAQGIARVFGYDLTAADIDNVDGRVCSGWKPAGDGFNEVKRCCTPSVGKGGIKIRLCAEISRPANPFDTTTPRPFGSPPRFPPQGMPL